MVVEGAARAGVADAGGARAGSGGARAGSGGVRVVAAKGSGDDTIAELAGDTYGRRVVVTADRQLRRRCEDAGAAVTGPRWLLGLL